MAPGTSSPWSVSRLVRHLGYAVGYMIIAFTALSYSRLISINIETYTPQRIHMHTMNSFFDEAAGAIGDTMCRCPNMQQSTPQYIINGDESC